MCLSPKQEKEQMNCIPETGMQQMSLLPSAHPPPAPCPSPGSTSLEGRFLQVPCHLCSWAPCSPPPPTPQALGSSLLIRAELPMFTFTGGSWPLKPASG